VLVSVSLTFTATGLGLVTGCIFTKIEVALTVVPLIFMPMMLFSGFFVNSSSILVFLKWIEYISPFRYSLEAFIYNEYENTQFTPNPITSLGFEYGFWESLILLLVIGGIFRVAGYFALVMNAYFVSN